jgi:polar amino acid transport system permease protein
MGEVRSYLPTLLTGFETTVKVTLLGILVAGLAAFVLGMARASAMRSCRWAAGVVVEFFRGTSVIVQLFWAYYALPLFTGELIPSLAAAVVVLGLNSGSYASEAVRGAIQGVPRGQRDAAIALGMSPWERMRQIILPQALPVMMPPFGNAAIDLLKASAVVGFINVQDTTFWANQIRALTGQTSSVYLVILVMYFVAAVVLSMAFKLIERSLPLRRIERRGRNRAGLKLRLGHHARLPWLGRPRPTR